MSTPNNTPVYHDCAKEIAIAEKMAANVGKKNCPVVNAFAHACKAPLLQVLKANKKSDEAAALEALSFYTPE